jgi:flagellar FliJ protein
MRRLRFRFQRLLELKERMEEARKIALGQAMAVLIQEQDQLAFLVQTRTQYLELDKGGPGLRLDVHLLNLHADFGLRLERQMLEQQESLRRAQVVVDERRAHLVEATRERRVYEILKERVVAQHRREQQRQDRMWLDEVGGRLHQRTESETAERNLEPDPSTRLR